MIASPGILSVADMIDDLAALVEIESPSRDVDQLTRSAEEVAAILVRRLGHEPRIIGSRVGPHVHWTGGGAPRVLLLGHHDTVFPVGTLARRPFGVHAGRATGPGVFDMLGGIVQAVHGLALLDDLSGVEMLITSDEEVGSAESRSLVEERAKACGAVLVLEGAAAGGALKIGRKGCGTFEVTVQGRAAHAGLEPEMGVNALVEAAHLVLAAAALSDPDAGTTVTPTVASAGTFDNVVPAAATVLIDVRVETDEEARRVEDAMADLPTQVRGSQVAVAGAVGRPPMPTSASADLFALARSIDPAIEGVSVGGGSDGNFTASVGVPTLDGLGAVGGGAHSDDEYILTDMLVPRAAVIAQLVSRLQAHSA